MRILAADDEPDVRLLLEVALGMLPDVELVVVDSGAAALAAAALSRFDLIVLDGLMPGLDGEATCRRLKADAGTAATPVVFLTALSDDARAALRDAGAAGFVRKPFDPFTLGNDLRAFIDGS